MTSKERIISALERKNKPDRVPHFELEFFLTMEAFGKVHHHHRNYRQWHQMSDNERQAHRRDIAQLYVDVARRFEHDAIFMQGNPNELEENFRLLDEIRNITGDQYFIMMHGDSTCAIPDGEEMEKLSFRMIDEPGKVEKELEKATEHAIAKAEKLKEHGGLDGFALCSDYCFNSGPFLPLDWFDRFVMPNLKKIIKAYRDMGFYSIKHTDGNIMPILDRLLEAAPDALHSLDPQGGVDMAEIVRLVGDKVTLCGNVDCGKMQTGTDEESVESACYALKNGKKAAGYIFCTSNCIYTGMPLSRYELILDVWREERYYQMSR